MRIGSLVGHPYLFNPRFLRLDHLDGQPSPTRDFHHGCRTSTGSGVCGTQTTTSFALSTVSHVCGNVAFSAANKLCRSTSRGVPHCSGLPVHKDFRCADPASTLATAAVAPIRPRLFLYPLYRAPTASRSSIASSIWQKSVTAFV